MDDGTLSTISTGFLAQTSHYLHASGFGFSVPTNAIINGILLQVKARSDNSNESSVKLAKGGVITGSERSTGSFLPTSLTYLSYGGSTDLWGTMWSASDVNDASFGAVWAIAVTSSSAAVDAFKVTVYYTNPRQMLGVQSQSTSLKLSVRKREPVAMKETPRSPIRSVRPIIRVRPVVHPVAVKSAAHPISSITLHESVVVDHGKPKVMSSAMHQSVSKTTKLYRHFFGNITLHQAKSLRKQPRKQPRVREHMLVKANTRRSLRLSALMMMDGETLFPSDFLYPSDTLYPAYAIRLITNLIRSRPMILSEHMGVLVMKAASPTFHVLDHLTLDQQAALYLYIQSALVDAEGFVNPTELAPALASLLD